MCISVCVGQWHDFERNAKEGNDEIFFFFKEKGVEFPYMHCIQIGWNQAH